MPADMAELLFSKPMNKLYQSLSTVLRDNRLVGGDDSQHDQKKTLKMIGAIIKVQNQLVNHDQNHSQISHELSNMTKEIGITPDSEQLINQLTVNFQIIDKNTSTLKQRIEVLE